jgi:DNA polymerase
MLIHCAVSKALVDLYRDENAPIPKLWRDMDAILHAMSVGLEMKFGPGGICQTVSEGIILPSGRRLRYPGLHLTEDGYVYRGSRSKTEWTKIYGAALVENITQALARDIIAEQMLWMRAEGRPIVTTTHDELVTRTRAADAPAAAKRVKEIMSTPPAWALGVPLAASGGHATTYGGAK